MVFSVDSSVIDIQLVFLCAVCVLHSAPTEICCNGLDTRVVINTGRVYVCCDAISLAETLWLLI